MRLFDTCKIIPSTFNGCLIRTILPRWIHRFCCFSQYCRRIGSFKHVLYLPAVNQLDSVNISAYHRKYVTACAKRSGYPADFEPSSRSTDFIQPTASFCTDRQDTSIHDETLKLTIEEALCESNSDFGSATELLRKQFDELDDKQRRQIVDCYDTLLPYPELLKIITETLDDELLHLVFSDLDFCTR